MATKIKVNGKWYRGSEKADGTIEFKDDLNYNGSTTQVEYIAKKPNPVLHPGLYHVYNMNECKEGEFWTDPQISYSGCISDIETDVKNSSGNSNPIYNNIPQKKPGCFALFFGWIFFLFRWFLKSWGGRIGVILGVIFLIIFIATGGGADGLNTILISLFFTIILGFIGKGIDGIIYLIRKNKE